MTACATYGHFMSKQYSVISDCMNAVACERGITSYSLRSEPHAPAPGIFTARIVLCCLHVLSFTSILCPCFGHRDHVGCANLLVLNQLGSCFRPRYLYLGEGLRTDVLCNGLIVSFL